jgi:hypothetical protein
MNGPFALPSRPPCRRYVASHQHHDKLPTSCANLQLPSLESVPVPFPTTSWHSTDDVIPDLHKLLNFGRKCGLQVLDVEQRQRPEEKVV